MRAICDSCESAPAVVFCAADEAALCAPCDQQVHGCNKLASRHLRLVLKESRDVPRCDICENARAFFFCGIDGTSLCMECDMAVHVGGKRTHTRYILIKQNVEFPAKQNEDENGMEEDEDKEEEDEEEVEEEEEEEEEEEKEDQMMQPFLEVGNKPPKDFLLKHMESCNVSSGWTIKEPQPQGNQQMSLSFDLNSNPTNA